MSHPKMTSAEMLRIISPYLKGKPEFRAPSFVGLLHGPSILSRAEASKRLAAPLLPAGEEPVEYDQVIYAAPTFKVPPLGAS